MKIHEIQGHIQSIFLAEYPKKLLLLDGCCRCDVDTVAQYIIDKLKRRPEEIAVVLVTHMHPDHAGGAELFRRRYGCAIATYDAQQDWYQGLPGTMQHLVDIALAYWVAYRMEKPLRFLWYPKHLQANYRLKDGQRVPLFKDWQVYATPGHTDCDISIMHQPSKTFYLADCILKVRKRFIAPFPVNYPDVYKESLQKILKAKPKLVLLAHGGKSKIQAEDILSLIREVAHRPAKHKVLVSIAKSFIQKPKIMVRR